MLARRLARDLAAAARARAPAPARAAASTATGGGGGSGTDFGEHSPGREKRQRRRAINGRLRQLRDADWDCGSGAGGAGAAAEEPDDAGDAALAALWRRFVREARGARERARVRRAWSTWKQHFASSGASMSAGTSAPGDGASAGGDDDDFASGFASAFGSGYETWYDAGPFEKHAEQPRWEHYTRVKAAHEEARARARDAGAGAGAAPGGRPAAAWAPAARADVREWLSTLHLAAAPAPTAATLKAAFRVAAFAHHPDRHGGDAAAARAAEARFKRCVAAAEALRPLVK